MVLRRRTLAIGVLLFVVLPIVEIWLLVLLGQRIGLLPVLAGVILEGLVGSWLIRRRWRTAWQSLQEASTGAPNGPDQQAETAIKGALDTAVFVFGGIALIFPGLITDLVGLICLLPFTRRLPRRLLAGFLDRRLVGLGDLTGKRRDPSRSGFGEVIEGEVVDDPPSEQATRDPDQPVVIRGEIDQN